MKKKMLKLDLLGNARSSLSHAVLHLTNDSSLTIDDYKYAIRDIVHAIELLFKEKLKRVHPAFMWSSVDKYPKSDEHTVTLNRAKQRLITIAGVTFTKKHLDNIKSIKELRNEIEHYEFEIDETLAKTYIGRMLSFIFWFSNEHLGLEWEAEFKREDTWSALINIYQFFEDHVEVVENRMNKEQRWVEECPECGACTYDIDEDECVICSCSGLLFECQHCGGKYFEYQMSENTEEMCENCEYEDGYASANFEKY